MLEPDMNEVTMEIHKFSDAEDFVSPIGFEITARTNTDIVLNMIKGANLLPPHREILFTGVEWGLLISRTTNDYLSFFLLCSGDSPEFNCLARGKFVITSQKPGVPNIEKEFSVRFDSDAKECGHTDFIPWHEFVRAENGFACAEEIILRVEIWAEPPPGKWWNSAERTGYVGLASVDSVPYLSSVLQILFFANRLRNAVYETPTSSRSGERNVTLYLQRIFFELEFSKDVVDSCEFFMSIAKVNKSSVNYRYEEYLRFLIDAIEKDAKGTKNKDIISNMFEGKINTAIKCENVDSESIKRESFREINLDVEGKSNIYEALTEFISRKKLDGESGGLQKATKCVKFEKLPPVLRIHLKRRSLYDTADGCAERTNSRFEFYDKIDLKEYTNCEGDALYSLQAVLVRSNEKYRNPYFVYISPNNDGLWYKFDNGVVCQVRKLEAVESSFGFFADGDFRCAVMLVYVESSKFADIMRPGKKREIFNIDELPPIEASLDSPVNFASFLDEESFSDVSIRVADDKSYRCHRLFLTSESLYFKNMFVGEKEARESAIDLRAHHLDTVAFDLVLRYIYGEKRVVTLQNICGVFEASTFLQIISLQRQAIGFVRKYNHANEVYKMLKIAKRMGDAVMLDVITSAILINRVFLASPSVSCLNSEEILFLIAKGNKITKEPKYLFECALKWAVEAENGANYLPDVLLKIDLAKISIRDIREISKAEFIEKYKSVRNQDIMLVSPILQRLLSGDVDVPYDQDEMNDISFINVDINDISDSAMFISRKTTEYSHLISTGRFSDTTVRVDSQSFRCHRALLAGCSQFFHAIFKNTNNYIENTNKEVVLDLDREIFAEIISLIYSGTFVITSKNITKILDASVFLNIDIAREKCIEYSKRNLVFDNALDVFITAYQHNIKILIEITKAIVLSNLYYLASEHFLTNINISTMRLLLDGSQSLNDQTALLYAILKWVKADNERSKFLSELLSTINLTNISKRDICIIFNENTNDTFRSINLTELGPLLERLLISYNTANLETSEANTIYLAMKVKNKYLVSEFTRDFHDPAVNNHAIICARKRNSLFEDTTPLDMRIGVSGKKIHALTWNPFRDMNFLILRRKAAKYLNFHPICAPGDRPMFHIPQYSENLENDNNYYVIPGLKSFTVFSDLGRAIFYIFDEITSTWDSQVLCEQSLFPEYDKLLVAGENNMVVLTAESHSDFKLVDIGTNSIINIPKPQFLKDDAAIALFNHRLYAFSFHNSLRVAAAFDLFSNEWIILPDIASTVGGALYGRLLAVGAGNCLHVFETREFCDVAQQSTSYECVVHHFCLDAYTWTSSVIIQGMVLDAIPAYTEYEDER